MSVVEDPSYLSLSARSGADSPAREGEGGIGGPEIAGVCGDVCLCVCLCVFKSFQHITASSLIQS